MALPHDPQADAAALVGGGHVRVLEPSPPAINEPPWFADDPTDISGLPADADVITPTTAGTRTWDELATTDPAIAAFARDHWLGNHGPLPQVPEGYVTAREDYHRLAFAVLANARREATTKIGLRHTHGGFGTPFFGADRQVRVTGIELVVQTGLTAETTPITTLRAATAAAGTVATGDQREHDTIELGDLDRTLQINPAVGAFLAAWFGFATSVLEQCRLLGDGDDDVSRVQVWPGHFDAAAELGSAAAGQRATYGASPGDETHAEPYLYVAAWGDVDRGQRYWNAETFGGAIMDYGALLAEDDPKAMALSFFSEGYQLLHY